MSSIEFNKVCKSYGHTDIIKSLDLSIEKEEFMVLVGPSGCGKSTTLRMIAGLEDITSGTLTINKHCVNKLQPKDRDVAMVFQSYALYPHLNVRDNIAFGLKIRKVNRNEIDKLVNHAASILGLTDLLDRKPKALSGGQRQRVALGRAIVRKPSVFLFDEPLSNLDAELRVQMRAEICKLQKQLATTSVYVTHDQVEAMTMGDRIAVMKGGYLMQVGSPMTLYHRPANCFVAGFIGTPPMNLLNATICHESKTLVLFEAKIPWPKKWAPCLQKSGSSAVIVGIRSEGIAADAQHQVQCSSVVEMIETLGHETIVHSVRDGQKIISKASGDIKPAIGETIHLSIDPEMMHLFDSHSEERLEEITIN